MDGFARPSAALARAQTDRAAAHTSEFHAYLWAARQARLASMARFGAANDKCRCRHWLCMAGVARRSAKRAGWRLP